MNAKGGTLLLLLLRRRRRRLVLGFFACRYTHNIAGVGIVVDMRQYREVAVGSKVARGLSRLGGIIAGRLPARHYQRDSMCASGGPLLLRRGRALRWRDDGSALCCCPL